MNKYIIYGANIMIARLKPFLYILGIFLSIELPLASMDVVTIESIGNNHELLKSIAEKIIERPQEIRKLKEKIIMKHGPKMFEVWKTTNKWGGIPLQDQGSLKKIFTRKQIESLIKRDEFVLMDNSIFSDPIKTTKNLIENGKITITTFGESEKKYAIIINYDLHPEQSGFLYKRTDLENPNILSKIYVTFDVDIIFKKMLEHNNYNWDENIDGSVTTLTPTERD